MGLFDRLKKGLSRTREKISSSFRSVLRIGRSIDQATLNLLGDSMLSADFGPTTTEKLIAVVRDGWTSGEISEEIVAFVEKLLRANWSIDEMRKRFGWGKGVAIRHYTEASIRIAKADGITRKAVRDRAFRARCKNGFKGEAVRL